MKRCGQLLLMLVMLALQTWRSAAAGIDTTFVAIKAVPGLQFDRVRFAVKPGALVKVTFLNTDDMDHNLVFTQPGAREQVVAEALKLNEKGPAMSFIPKSPKVLYSIPVTSPDEVRSLTFTAPAQSGVFPYVCTYPGHGFVMYGAMYVTTATSLPEITQDENLPTARRVAASDVSDSAAANKSASDHHHPSKPLHPYTPVPPYLYRVFIAGAGPAAIAVNLPNDVSYCWDAGTCSLRFAWKGGFLDNSDLWKGKGDAEAKVVGKIFYRAASPVALYLNDSLRKPVFAFKGYRLVNRYPEFHYLMDGTDVYELIRPKEDGKGLIRKFRIPGCRKVVWFAGGEVPGMHVASSAGSWSKGRLKLSPAEAKSFTVTMTIEEGRAPL